MEEMRMDGEANEPGTYRLPGSIAYCKVPCSMLPIRVAMIAPIASITITPTTTIIAAIAASAITAARVIAA